MNEGRIEAVERSVLFGFPDEIAIRITSTDSRSRIDIVRGPELAGSIAA